MRAVRERRCITRVRQRASPPAMSTARMGREVAGWHRTTGLPPSCSPHSQCRPWRHAGNTPRLFPLFSQLCYSPFRHIGSFL